jgi:hypothetical protein
MAGPVSRVVALNVLSGLDEELQHLQANIGEALKVESAVTALSDLRRALAAELFAAECGEPAEATVNGRPRCAFHFPGELIGARPEHFEAEGMPY